MRVRSQPHVPLTPPHADACAGWMRGKAGVCGPVVLALALSLSSACRLSQFDDLLRDAEHPHGDADAPEGEEGQEPEPKPDAAQSVDMDSSVLRAEAGPTAEASTPFVEASSPTRETGMPDADANLTDAQETSVPAEASVQETSVQETSVLPEICLNDASDPLRCGCKADCDRPNADHQCVSGRCVRACLPNFDDCNLDLMNAASDGCEVDLRTNDVHCSMCGQACTTEQERFVGCQDKICKPLTVTAKQLRVFDRCLSVSGPSSEAGTDVHLWSCGSQLPEQEWALTPAGELRGYANKCLDVEGPSLENGTAIQIWDCVRVPQQTWRLNSKGQIVGLGEKCIQVKDGISSDGQKIELHDCMDIPAQRFTWVTP